ncbi:WD repeat and FYVE domain-containing protein 2-like [Hydractinia symbiolongicarpus]|uniref:WD repeat and FYVE domain-containing protein 2-like n=1 Tax=Hydractinia symbiolongicarpus TaxID=13093 RepID=UPI0025509F28|nr:WD repeat and FYVE domain-containing protein 2-like [Hydractinia symbiolongicarpus]
MAAELKSSTQSRNCNKKPKPILISKLDLPGDSIYSAVFIPHEDSVITVSSDKSIRVWIQRQNGQFWPSICHYMPEAGTCLDYNKESGKVFVGLSNGTIQEYSLSDDCNKLNLVRNYIAHNKRVRSIVYALDYNWLLSCSNDKQFQWHCTKTGKRIGGYTAKASCTCLQFDMTSSYAFMGDFSGEIHVLKLSEDGLKPITVLKGHSGSVQCLTWDAEKKWLYSGSFDKSVIVWDIGGQKGSAVELHGHLSRVRSIGLASHADRLFSVGDDQDLTVWNTRSERKETPTWSQSDMCEKCASPFFWNFKQMWDQRIVGVRQHHCRRCGRAVCHNCSDKTSVLPQMGYEFDVRLCEECYDKIEDEEKISTSTFHDLKHGIAHLNIDLSKSRMLTCGVDNMVKIWDIRELLDEGR